MDTESNNNTLAPSSAPANTFGVAAGQIWQDRDKRRPRTVTVTAVNETLGVALTHNTETGRKSSIRLDRFSTVHHMSRVVLPTEEGR